LSYDLFQQAQWIMDQNLNHGDTEGAEQRLPAPRPPCLRGEASIEIYVLSWERFETLALCLAGLCGFNRGVGRIHVIDDASADPRVHRLLAMYRERGLVDEVDRLPANVGIGPVRRRVFDKFLETGSEHLVQVEGDMLLPPGAIAQLVTAYRDIRATGAGIAWLATHQHDWCHRTIQRRRLAGYDVGIAASGSEPFWTTERDLVRDNLALLPSTRPDLVLFLRALYATVLYDPEIQVQHLGAINSHYYPQWTPGQVTYTNADGSMRQPFPWFNLDFHLPRERYGPLYLQYAEILRARSPVGLPSALDVEGTA